MAEESLAAIAGINASLEGQPYKAAVVPIEGLELLEKNARFMRNETFRNLVENIKRDGGLSSVPFCLKTGDRFRVLSGNHRVQAAKEAGLETVLILYTDRAMTRSEEVAIQLSHNALVGEDDPVILKELWDELEDISFKFYAGLDDKLLGELANISLDSLSEVNLDFRSFTFLFLPEEVEHIDQVFDEARQSIAMKDSRLAGLAEFDRLMSALAKAQASHNVKNVAVALMLMLESFERHLTDLSDGWLSEEEEVKHKNGNNILDSVVDSWYTRRSQRRFEMNEPTTLVEVIRYFADPDICLAFMVNLRWADGVVTCPTCERDDVRFIPTRRIWECRSKHPRRQFSVKVGTIFEDSPISLDKWLATIWMIANDKNGVSSYEISRAIGVTQKTAWFMLHRIRLAMQDGDFGGMSGEVEVDETFIGGKARNMHNAKRKEVVKGRGTVGKTTVMGLLERHGPDGHSAVTTKIVANTRRSTLSPEVRRNVMPGATVYTDAHSAYTGLDAGYIHEVIDHAHEYVRGRVHTNGIENFWSLLKRAIKGTYVSVEPFHLFRYLDEESYRYNTRETNDASRFNGVMNGVAGKRLTYKQLTGSVTA